MSVLVALFLGMVLMAFIAVVFVNIKDDFMSAKEELVGLIDELKAVLSSQLDSIHAKVDALQVALAAGTPISSAELDEVKAALVAAKDSLSSKGAEIIADEQA